MVKKNKPKLAKAIYEAMINACNCRRGRGRVMCSGSKICKLCEFFQTVYCKLEFVTCLLKYVRWMESHEPNVAISPSDSLRSLSTRSRFAISNYSFLFLSISQLHYHQQTLQRQYKPHSFFLIPPSPFQSPDSTNARTESPPSPPQWLPESRTPSTHYSQQHTFYPERTRQTQIVRFLKDRKCSQRGGQTTSMRHFLVLVESVLVHRATRFQITELARNSSHVLLELFSTTHHPFPYSKSLRRKLFNHNRELHINIEAFFRPLVSNRHIVHISTGKQPHKIILFTNVINTVHNGEFVVTTNVVARSIESLREIDSPANAFLPSP